jgi:nitrogen-specific signal transduction histidine kinase
MMRMDEMPLDLTERDDHARVAQDAQLIASVGVTRPILDAMPSMVLMLNKERQIVFANARLLERLGFSSDSQALGKRPGELLDCIQASEALCGCGTGPFCTRCGAARAILHAHVSGRTSVRECRILTVDGAAYDFKVWASPYVVREREFTIFCLEDIGDHKRREALEKVFFHDLNNALGVIVGCADLLEEPSSSEESAKLSGTICSAIDGVLDEISAHKSLLAAENGELSITVSRVSSVLLLKEIQRLFAEGAHSQDDSIVLADDCEEFVVVTDRTLLRRVFGNMVKNAIEAADDKARVRITCKRSETAGIFSVHGSNYMPESVQRGVFLRSFSTRGKGRGLGTYSMKLFGETHLGGKVWFESSEREGTTFHVSIPLQYHGV